MPKVPSIAEELNTLFPAAWLRNTARVHEVVQRVVKIDIVVFFWKYPFSRQPLEDSRPLALPVRRGGQDGTATTTASTMGIARGRLRAQRALAG